VVDDARKNKDKIEEEDNKENGEKIDKMFDSPKPKKCVIFCF